MAKTRSSLNEIAYSIFNKVRPQISDDEEISLADIKHDIYNLRATYLANDMNRSKTIDDAIQQTICAELESADKSQCCDIQTDCKLLRTKKDIPNTIALTNKKAITDVSPIDFINKPFSFVPYRQAVWVGNGRFNGDAIFAFLYEDRIWLKSNPKNNLHKLVKYVLIRGVFENPEDAKEFRNCNDNSQCYSDDDPFPISRKMETYIHNTLVQQYLQTSLAPFDEESDAKHELNANIKSK